jgi:hypothetical protein
VVYFLQQARDAFAVPVVNFSISNSDPAIVQVTDSSIVSSNNVFVISMIPSSEAELPMKFSRS